MQKKKEGKGGDKKDDKVKEKVEEVNAVTYKDDGEVLFTLKSSCKFVGGSK